MYSGYAKSARRVGIPYDIYRPSSVANPLAAGNKLGTIKAAFAVHSSGNFNFAKPSDYKGPMFHALLDGAQVQVGDYLNDPATVFGPFFIASMNPIVPILAVQTTRVITIFRPDGVASKVIGVSGYGGTVASTANANETAIMTAWPASVLEGSRGTNAGLLPGDIGVGIWRVLLPARPGVLVLPGYLITDDAQNRMVVRQAELTDLGWNIQAVQALV